MERNNCRHQRVKKNYPFGRKSRAIKKCKTCGEIVTNKMLEKKFQDRRKERNRW